MSITGKECDSVFPSVANKIPKGMKRNKENKEFSRAFLKKLQQLEVNRLRNGSNKLQFKRVWYKNMKLVLVASKIFGRQHRTYLNGKDEF